MKRRGSSLAVGLAFAWLGLPLAAACAGQEAPRYVGSKPCAPCHAEQYASYAQYAKKAHSSKSLQLMVPELTPDELKGCYACHTTGYGQPGGFQGFTETPELADAGCEVCHGPGSAHAASGDPSQIKGKPTLKDCVGCHNAQRVKAFNFKPLLRGGAH